jgi:hypothetical protein
VARKGSPDAHPVADLRGADLRGADLRGAELRGADLRGADLTGATLSDVTGYNELDLPRASRCVALRGARLERARFTDCIGTARRGDLEGEPELKPPAPPAPAVPRRAPAPGSRPRRRRRRHRWQRRRPRLTVSSPPLTAFVAGRVSLPGGEALVEPRASAENEGVPEQPKNPFGDDEVTVGMGSRHGPAARPGPRPAGQAGPRPTGTAADPSRSSGMLPPVKAAPGRAGPSPAAPGAALTKARPAPAASGAGPARGSGAGPAVKTSPGQAGPTPGASAARGSASLTATPRRTSSGDGFASAFDSEEQTRTEVQRVRTLGAVPAVQPPPRRTLTKDEVKAVARRFDGNAVPSAAAMSASMLQPVNAEVVSAPGARDPLLSRVVLDQFAPEINRRYASRESGHIFVWDYANAMGCQVPRYRASGELSIAQVCSWFRTLAADAGWIKIVSSRAAELSGKGYPVIALPRNPQSMLLAVVRPDERGGDGMPLLASACRRHRGNKLTIGEAFGERQAEFYFHD